MKRNFWSRYSETFDTNENGALDKDEFLAMLDCLGTEVTQQDVDELVILILKFSFFLFFLFSFFLLFSIFHSKKKKKKKNSI